MNNAEMLALEAVRSKFSEVGLIKDWRPTEKLEHAMLISDHLLIDIHHTEFGVSAWLTEYETGRFWTFHTDCRVFRCTRREAMMRSLVLAAAHHAKMDRLEH